VTAPTAYPGPRSNRNRAGFIGRADDLTGSDIIVAVGDYTGGAAEDLFTLNAHGLVTGDYLWLLYKDAAGAVTGTVGTGFRAKVLSANTFQITNLAGTLIENTADGATVVFLKGTHATTDAIVETVILPFLIVANGDYTGGAAEDIFIPTVETGYHFLEEAEPLLILYKAAAGVITGKTAGATVYAKTVTTAQFELAATAAGADIENTADGLAIFLKLV
jgi:hypothetical protein